MKYLWCFVILTYSSLVLSNNNKGKKTTSSSQPEPNIIEIDLAAQNTLKEVAISSSDNPTSSRISDAIPSKKFCGLQHTDDRIYTETDTALDEFPWLVDIVHQDNISICPGVLISNQFVLTGYGCGLFSYKVRLGLYHTKQDITCVVESNIEECSDPVVEVNVEKEMYTNAKGEIALLKLVEGISYSEYIRPVCLPTEESIRPTYGSEVVASGWGKNVEDAKGSSKKRLLFKLQTPQECKTLDRSTQIISNSDEFCFISEEDRNDIGCIDDYGGPIMYTHRHQWYVEGILVGPYNRNMTYGYCSESVKPIYGKKITTEILNWIIRTVSSQSLV
ncbi:hypothetical protein ILUMI_04494 [Ignelater luminosus]|uniref:Peptidase S1 domain-containing protein n=1 Tax=Ignelater luminosus TaxID=2038154 RepID=A0A8K0GJJ0_IGNLU|nr:hypothetical protein ILUMI_04494 [Ignelater luminosus]